MSTYDYSEEDVETSISIDKLAFETMIRRHPVRPPLNTVELQERLDVLAYKLLGEDDGGTDTEPGPEEGTGDDGDDDGGN